MPKFLFKQGSVCLLLAVTALPLLADEDADRIAALEEQAAALAIELQALQQELQEAQQTGRVSDEAELRKDVNEALTLAQSAERTSREWKESAGVTHLAGYASADYVDPEGESGFFTANFNPMFHYMYRDLVLWESELEIEVGEDGETEIGLEYSTIDLFLNDSMVLMAGKFLSPLGQFRQNLHPSWINKLPSAPVGFGHDGAAPEAEIGVQLRGGIRVGDSGRFGYSGYVGNGPKLEAEDGEIHGIETGGFASNHDGENVFGGRISYVPLPKLEFGLSGAVGKVAITENDGEEVDDDPSRDYDAFGIDASYQLGALDLRGEYIEQKISDEALSVIPEGGKWKSWYAQGAYKFGRARWEAVLRYGDFSSPHSDQTQEQVAIGLNHLIAPHAILKIGYEFNDGLAGEPTDADRLLLQIAYGF